MNSPDRSPLDQHRIVVADATFDELEDKLNVYHSQDDDVSDVDNTHPYLMKYAEIYADENNNIDASSAAATGPTFVDVKPPSQFKEGEKVMYKGSKDLPSSEAVVTKIMYDEKRHPHYPHQGHWSEGQPDSQGRPVPPGGDSLPPASLQVLPAADCR